MESATTRDLRAEWEGNPELRRSVQEELRNWAIWSFERANEHGYPHQQPWYTPPRDARDRPPAPPAVDVRAAEETEGWFRFWRTIARAAKSPERELLALQIRIVRLHYLTNKPGLTKARIVGVSRPHYYRLLEQAEYRYWVIRS